MALVIAGGIAALPFLGGCASSDGPQVLNVDPQRYNEVFDTAEEEARKHGMPALLKDRRSGVIETATSVTGSALEPWRTDNASFSQAMANTVAYQRRRTRFEFSPVGFHMADIGAPTTGELPGADVVGLDRGGVDLTQNTEPMELRVWVFVERANIPGVRRSTWTRSKTTTAKLLVPEVESGLTQGINWTPITRDTAYERRLLAAIERTMAASAPQPTTAPDEQTAPAGSP